MTTISTHTTFDAAALRRAYSDRDAAACWRLYADDADDRDRRCRKHPEPPRAGPGP